MPRVLCSNGCCFECEECSRKPGSPTLCKECLNLRATCAAVTKDQSKGADFYQVGGDHYKREVGQQHWNRAWDLFREAWFVLNVTKYVERYRKKDGVKDLKKARQYLEKLIELEEADAEKNILSSMTTRESPEGKNTDDRHEQVYSSLIHAVDGNVSLCGIQVGNMNCTVYRPYVNCPRCKEKFQ